LICAKTNLIQYYELWNEANDQTHYWDGTETQLYQMVKPAVAIIRSKVGGAKILTPSVNDCTKQTCPGQNFILYTTWQSKWLGMDNLSGRISDIYNFHTYLDTSTPENQWGQVVVNMLLARNQNSGWANSPWWNTETGFSGSKNGDFKCQNPDQNDCTGQIARWQLLHASNGGTNLSWYQWKSVMQNDSPICPSGPCYLEA
jgi:hypothetical protein